MIFEVLVFFSVCFRGLGYVCLGLVVALSVLDSGIFVL